uniref:Uncharacterized protein n=1 Tax=Glossina morsitans morsitans TaxID=37546 RepID=A0A1B0G963_GLOMM
MRFLLFLENRASPLLFALLDLRMILTTIFDFLFGTKRTILSYPFKVCRLSMIAENLAAQVLHLEYNDNMYHFKISSLLLNNLSRKLLDFS